MASIPQDRHEKHLGFAFFAGPVLWALQLLVGYLLANLASLNSLNKLLYSILNGIVVLIILAAGVVAVVSWRRLSRTRHPKIENFDEPVNRREFVATSGLYLSILFFWLTLMTGIFALFLSPARMITQPFP